MAVSILQPNPKDTVDVRMLRHVVGPGGNDLFKGEEYRLPAQDAAYMIYAHQAEEIGEDADPETAQEKYTRLQLEAAEALKQGKRKTQTQVPVDGAPGPIDPVK